jgi:hypothetical protein
MWNLDQRGGEARAARSREEVMLEVSLMSAVRLVRSILSLDFSQQIERVRIDNAVQSLRQIFFFPSELRYALEKISDGKRIDLETAKFFAQEFRIVPARIEDAFEFLRVERFEDGQRVLIADIQMMREIQIGKIDVRREISRFFQDYVLENRGGGVRAKIRDDAARILGQIDRLNSAIRECEAKLLSARNSRAGIIEPRAARRSPPAKRRKKD